MYNSMKSAFSICLAASVVALAACRNANPEAVEAQHQSDYAAPADEPLGVQRMNPYDFTDTVRVGHTTYVCRIERHASDSLPTVTDDYGVEFADNVYRLTIHRDGAPFVERSFTKAAFAHLLSDDMARRGVLYGMRADTTVAGLAFAVSVSQPQSDVYVPILLTVDAGGGIAIARDTRGMQ